MPDYIPDDDDEFDTYITDQFAPYVAANFAELGLTAGDNTNLQGAQVSWHYAFVGHTNAKAAAAAAVQEKDLQRGIAQAQIRYVANKV